MTFAQEQLWFIDEFHHGLPAHNLPSLIRLSGALDAGRAGPRDRRAGGPARGAADPAAGLVRRAGRCRWWTRRAPFGVAGAGGPVRAWSQGSGRRRLREVTETEALAPFTLAAGATAAHLPGPAGASRARAERGGAPDGVRRLVAAGVLPRAGRPVRAAQHAAAVPGEPAVLNRTGTAAGAVRRLRGVGTRAADRARRWPSWRSFWRGALGGFESPCVPADRPRPLLASHDGAVQVTMMDAELLDGLRELSGAAGHHAGRHPAGGAAGAACTGTPGRPTWSSARPALTGTSPSWRR